GQERLLATSAAVVGCGALGAFQAGALARAGIGRILLIDRDFVETSTLQRQSLYDESDARDALPKAVAAARAVARINSSIRVEPLVEDLTPANIADLLEGAAIILDGTDNFETRYLLNDWAIDRAVPWIYGGAVGSYGLSMPIIPGSTACFECIYPEPPSGAQPTCETAGVVNTITALVASWQVSLALRILTGAPVQPRITTFDVWTGDVRHVSMPSPHPACPACALRSCRHLHGADRVPISLCGRNAVQIHDRRRPLDLASLAATLSPLGDVRFNGFALRFTIPPHELTVFPDGRAIIKGTQDPALARSLYSRYIGN
ncbi:MAG: ThiF family adenylyltransferase, partial [Acidobacteria bacterium]|nr:ThiF family adenylyltransferase [Acidobacteriota bacterium]